MHPLRRQPPSVESDLPATGGWRSGDPPAGRQFADLCRGRAFALEGGGKIRGLQLAYETWGTLDDTASNAILICHALTGDAHAAGPSGPGQPSEGWWDQLIGPGRHLDTDRYFIVCANALGGCQGSTGPISPHS
ncbi:MAG: homoserine O-acetyltransferase, partial [Actinomycetota bacterium]